MQAIKWESGSNFTSTFSGVTIDATMHDKVCDLGDSKSITFKGTCSPVPFTSENRSILFLGGNNNLYYPDGTGTGITIGAFRAYFQLVGITASPDPSQGGGDVKAFVLNFGGSEDATSIDHSPLTIDHSAGGWYSLDGRRLDGKPSKVGIYINNGRKVVVK